MKAKGSGFFWPSFTDLMTSMFFIMLVLFILSYARLKIKVDDLDRKLKVYNLVEENLRPLKSDTFLFRYEEEFKRYTLAFDVKFKVGMEILNVSSLDTPDPSETLNQIRSAGLKLKQLINSLALRRKENPELSKVSYLVIISGYASDLNENNEFKEYQRSYNRAWNLWNHWKSLGINFEDASFQNLIDLQISGNGLGGIGRFERDPNSGFENEAKNQRFIIQVVPKIGDTR
jgi:hypothetical protein